MRFLLDANMPRRAAPALRGLGHDCLDVRDLQMRHAGDAEIAKYAKDHSLTLLTRDRDFGVQRNYPPQQYHGIVVMDLPDQATANLVVTLLISFVKNQPVLDLLPGRLAIVKPGGIRLRPAPTE
ncbi:MAG: DUF5615 family PIN-like protein [Tepidisphaeraceae bacterium]|jgi:predicted nuclease of predicted toxin-antitoxin system